MLILWLSPIWCWGTGFDPVYPSVNSPCCWRDVKRHSINQSTDVSCSPRRYDCSGAGLSCTQFSSCQGNLCGVNVGLYAINQTNLVKSQTHSSLWRTIHTLNPIRPWDTLFVCNITMLQKSFFFKQPMESWRHGVDQLQYCQNSLNYMSYEP